MAKPITQYVVVRQSYDPGANPGKPNYYVGKLKVFEDGEVDETIILEHVGSRDGVRVFTSELVARANKEGLSEAAIKAEVLAYHATLLAAAKPKTPARSEPRETYYPKKVEVKVTSVGGASSDISQAITRELSGKN